MDVAIRPASIKHLNRLFEIEKQCFSKEAFTRQLLGHLLGDPNALVLEAHVGEEITGFIIGRIDVGRTIQFGHIITLEVEPSYRRKGISRKLLNEIEKAFRSKGVKEVRLEVREDNEVALSLYQESGYVLMGRIEGYYGDAHGLYLKKEFGARASSKS